MLQKAPFVLLMMYSFLTHLYFLLHFKTSKLSMVEPWLLNEYTCTHRCVTLPECCIPVVCVVKM